MSEYATNDGFEPRYDKCPSCGDEYVKPQLAQANDDIRTLQAENARLASEVARLREALQKHECGVTEAASLAKPCS